MPDHIVKQGECIESIAFMYGLLRETVWNHPNNRKLKEDRKNPNILLPGDKVFVPDKSTRQETGGTEARHRFRKKEAQSKIGIVLKDERGDPRANLSYVLNIDGRLFKGKTNGQGRLEQVIPPDARKGKLTIGTEGEEYDLDLGRMDPVSEVTGVQSRLKNLGFDCNVNGSIDERTREAIRSFQRKHGLEETGEPDDPTRQKLEQEHAS